MQYVVMMQSMESERRYIGPFDTYEDARVKLRDMLTKYGDAYYGGLVLKLCSPNV